jgi:GDP-L-fucose synthase
MIHYAHVYDVKRIMSFGSTSAFPADIENITEEDLHKGPVSEDYYGYASAKRCIDIQNKTYNLQHQTNFVSIFPGTIFGPYDNFDPDKGRVIPAMISKVVKAKSRNENIFLLGGQKVKRELIFSLDLARIVVNLIWRETLPERLLVVSDVILSIEDIVKKICDIAKFKGKIVWGDQNGSNSYRKSDTSLLKNLMPDLKFTNIDNALETAYNFYIENNEIYP